MVTNLEDFLDVKELKRTLSHIILWTQWIIDAWRRGHTVQILSSSPWIEVSGRLYHSGILGAFAHDAILICIKHLSIVVQEVKQDVSKVDGGWDPDNVQFSELYETNYHEQQTI